jgi:Variant SH3 domain
MEIIKAMKTTSSPADQSTKKKNKKRKKKGKKGENPLDTQSAAKTNTGSQQGSGDLLQQSVQSLEADIIEDFERFRVKALVDRDPHDKAELLFSVGQIITITYDEGDEWYLGEYENEAGEIVSGLVRVEDVYFAEDLSEGDLEDDPPQMCDANTQTMSDTETPNAPQTKQASPERPVATRPPPTQDAATQTTEEAPSECLEVEQDLEELPGTTVLELKSTIRIPPGKSIYPQVEPWSDARIPLHFDSTRQLYPLPNRSNICDTSKGQSYGEMCVAVDRFASYWNEVEADHLVDAEEDQIRIIS